MINRSVKYDSINALKEIGYPIIIVAAVREAEAIKYACDEANIKVSAFCDTEKRKTFEPFCGLKVIHTPKLKSIYPKARFLIASQHILDVADQLTGMDYSEFYSALELLEDYNVSKNKYLISQSYMESRVSVYKRTHQMYFDDNKTYMRSLDIMVTTKCSLKCKNCSNLMQYYKNPNNTYLEETLKALNVINKSVDEISEYRIIGGEPLMNKDWANIVKSILDTKPGRNIFIYTNGTITPKDEQLELFKDENVNFIVTDYGKLSRNINKLIPKLEQHGLTYVRTPPENWVDCSSIRHHKRSVTDLKEVFKQCCVKYVYTLLNGKLYRCPFIANADNLNAIPDNPANYVDLFSKNTDTDKKIKWLVNNRKFFPACDFCDGRPYDPSSKVGYDGEGMIVPAKQSPQPIDYKEYK
jgi:organic radical activating enzyme